MSLIRFIILFIVGYFIYKGVKYIFGLMASRQNQKFRRNTKQNGSKIDRKDIIDADFEEIENDKEKK